ncbi:MAG: efflux RND transporter periplasmic adaptor subunit [Thermodesulfobacteriota bacterium]
MKRGLRCMALLSALWIGCWGCSKGKEETQTQGKAATPPIAVEAVRVQALDLTESIEAVGTLTPRFEAKLKSEYAGMVTDVYINEWVRVRKGTPLAVLDTREIEAVVQKAQAAVEAAKANLLQAEVGGARAERELSRAQNLKESGLITQQMLDEVKTEKAASAARIAAAKAQLMAAEKDLHHARTRLVKAVLRSPMDGVVAVKNINIGDLVGEPGTQRILFHIVDNRLLELTVTVPSLDMGRLKTGQALTFTTDAFPGQIFSGRVQYVNPTVSDSDRSVKIVAEIPNPKEILKAGLFVKGRIITGQRRGVLQIPRTALLSWDVGAKKGEVYVVEGNRAQRKTFETGAVSVDWMEVVSGLKAGDSVITRGGFNVKNGEPVRITRLNGGK